MFQCSTSVFDVVVSGAPWINLLASYYSVQHFFFFFWSFWIANTPNTLPHPHSFHSFFHPQLDSAGSVWFSNEIGSLCLRGKIVSIYNSASNLPPGPGGAISEAPTLFIHACLILISFFYRSASLQAFDSVYMSPVWSLYLHLNWAEICRWTLLNVLFTPKDYFPLPLSVSVTRF